MKTVRESTGMPLKHFQWGISGATHRLAWDVQMTRLLKLTSHTAAWH
jgi:hypothetical protein